MDETIQIGSTDGDRCLHVDRSDAASQLLSAAANASAVVVHGESGVGKSALALLSATAAATADPDAVQALCINLRQLPSTTLEFEAILGCPLAMLFGELSASQRMLIIDSADAVSEGMVDALRYLLDAARHSDLTVIAVTALDSKQVVSDTLIERFEMGVAEYAVPALTDVQLDEVVARLSLSP